MNRPVPLAIALMVILVSLGCRSGAAFAPPPVASHPELPRYASDAEQFKYGSIGLEATVGIPERIWTILPEAFPELLPRPGGYETFGFFSERGHDLPIGISRANLVEPYVSVNCAACHTSQWRVTAAAPPDAFPGGASTTLDFLRYYQFLNAVGRDARFTPEYLLPFLTRRAALGDAQRALYRDRLIPEARERLSGIAGALAWTGQHNRPAWGAGQIDAFNPAKFGILKLPDDGSVGNVDIMALWTFGTRRRVNGARSWLHADGLTDEARTSILSSGLALGANAKTFPFEAVPVIERFLTGLKAPRYPLPIDRALARSGEGLWMTTCASCHAENGARVLTIIPGTEVGTDTARLVNWSDAARDAYSAYNEGYAWNLHFANHEGWVAPLLEGIWLRAPYLHNGSVPTVWDLLQPAAQRPSEFYRGYDVLDRDKLGFISAGAEAAAGGQRFDTRLPSRGNSGHEYGVGLSIEQKRALIEFLKTL